MNKQLKTQVSYLVMMGNLFVSNLEVLTVTRNIANARQFDSVNAERAAKELGGVVVRKTVEYEVILHA
ncbi:hypothetical protein P4I81_08015 [Bacillus cereus]|uniref:hypothetical protein n=1 Tax=Bacillus thuringiensis TaxID=1428 RepID=UPI0004489D71|nr:hypothetical protein [Bacillus thuringiensis]ANT40104.1 hypothetical protein BMBtpLA4_10 [Bacillus phage vB_BtS_BMBtp15]MCU5100549.1 hypothetical protein [Bacillus cereus]EXY09389.1 hypothetical protein BF15_27935 [Bacillus thuringiensis]MEB8632411.1 hypothetical protein [Bacillus cereus]MEB8741411.1 hypothetical protein [Bacillus cereus]